MELVNRTRLYDDLSRKKLQIFFEKNKPSEKCSDN